MDWNPVAEWVEGEKLKHELVLFCYWFQYISRALHVDPQLPELSGYHRYRNAVPHVTPPSHLPAPAPIAAIRAAPHQQLTQPHRERSPHTTPRNTLSSPHRHNVRSRTRFRSHHQSRHRRQVQKRRARRREEARRTARGGRRVRGFPRRRYLRPGIELAEKEKRGKQC